ncbi:MAG: hypothetical protein LBU32_14710 [Clostridiales bacterium]|jgi:oligogalacturonide transport system permease protein|nr:hypothetical protein [Clostridiales bacterium]
MGAYILELRSSADSVAKYPVSLGLRLSMDMESQIQWRDVLAMALLSIMLLAVAFFFSQRYFVVGVATTGLKE